VSLLQEFKAFAMRGNVVDLAVGVVIGGAFGKIVTALVDKMIMPIVGFLTGGINIADAKWAPPSPAEGITPPTLGYGAFVQEVVNFTIIAFVLFLLIKAMNTMKKKQEEAPPAPVATPEDVLLLREIRDALSKSSPRRAE
jgi:large conductance mechanosensitive channel